MKFYLKILVLFLAAASLFTACGLRTDTFNDDTKIPLREGDTLSVQISLEYPSGSKAADSLMRKSILTAAFDMEEDPTTVEETASKYESNLEDAYFTEAQDLPVEGPFSWDDFINGYFTDGYKNLRSYIIEYYSYRGGAHGVNTLTALVFDKKSGEQIQEKDILVDNYSLSLSSLLQKHLPEAFDGNEEEYDSLFITDIVSNGNFEPGKTGITWYYQPYEIGPYSLGVIPVSVPWNELKPLLR